MKKILSLKKCLSDNGGLAYSGIGQKYHPTSLRLGCVKLVLSGYHRDWWVDYYQNDKTIVIYPDDLIKRMLDTSSMSKEERKKYEESFDDYHDKRWDDMPKVEITNENWKDLEKKWKLSNEEKPEYIVLYLDDSGPLDKVEIVFKEQLSEEDIALMKSNFEDYLKYKKARDLYLQNHPDYSEVWRGPQDDEYEADIMKYYDKDE